MSTAKKYKDRNMKIGTIICHNGDNHGVVLQAYALVHIEFDQS